MEKYEEKRDAGCGMRDAGETDPRTPIPASRFPFSTISEGNKTFVIEHTLPQERLDVFLCSKLPGISRGAIQRLIDEGHILVNGEKTKPAASPHAGDAVSLRWPELRPAEAQPENIPIPVLYEDEDVIVVNKPAGMVVHPSDGHQEHTLVNALLHHCKGQLSGIGGVARPGIIHRLDMDTSGCLIVAKNDPAHLALGGQFAEREVVKIYHAIVCGEPTPETGDIRAPIARNPSQRKKMAVIDSGRDAWTSYRTLKRLKESTLVEMVLHTGRTHQIRIHFKHIGFPLLGDTVYGKRQNTIFKASTGFTAARQMLHALNITFTHPRTKEKIKCHAPLPEDFQSAIEALSP